MTRANFVAILVKFRKSMLFLVLSIVLLQSSIGYADISNKGLICESDSFYEKLPITKYTGFWFTTEKNYEWWRADITDNNKNGDSAEFTILFGDASTLYKIEPDYIYLYLKKFGKDEPDTSHYVKVDRYDLTAVQLNSGKYYNHTCSLLTSLPDFIKELEKISQEFPNFKSIKPKVKKL